MRFVLLGPPGAGKGSLAAVIKKALPIIHLSTGDLLRLEVKTGSPLGLQIQALIDKGSLVSDDIATQIVRSKVVDDPVVSTNSFMLDGYPRTVSQAEDLDKMLAQTGKTLDFVINMEADLELILRRIVGRRVCRKCGSIYHLTNKPARVSGICDTCGGQLYQRADDNEETVKARMKVYASSTQPIVDYYMKQGKIKILNGNLETAELYKEFLLVLK